MLLITALRPQVPRVSVSAAPVTSGQVESPVKADSRLPAHLAARRYSTKSFTALARNIAALHAEGVRERALSEQLGALSEIPGTPPSAEVLIDGVLVFATLREIAELSGISPDVIVAAMESLNPDPERVSAAIEALGARVDQEFVRVQRRQAQRLAQISLIDDFIMALSRLAGFHADEADEIETVRAQAASRYPLYYFGARDEVPRKPSISPDSFEEMWNLASLINCSAYEILLLEARTRLIKREPANESHFGHRTKWWQKILRYLIPPQKVLPDKKLAELISIEILMVDVDAHNSSLQPQDEVRVKLVFHTPQLFVQAQKLIGDFMKEFPGTKIICKFDPQNLDSTAPPVLRSQAPWV